jgi:hypothetical protein
MQDEPIDEDVGPSDEELFDGFLSEMRIEHLTLHMMLEADCAPIWTVWELGLALRSDVFAEESVRRLQAAGLVHRLGEFVFPTQAAIRFRQLAAGD